MSRLTGPITLFVTGVFFFVWILGSLGFGADCWWLLAQGANLVRDGEWPDRNFSAFTVDPEERYQVVHLIPIVIYYHVYSLAGPAGPLVLAALLYAMTFLVLFALILRRHVHPAAACVMTSLALWISPRIFFVRAETFTGLYFAIEICLLESRFPSRVKSLLLILLVVLWVNTHMSFLVGIAVILSYSLGNLLASLAARTDPEAASCSRREAARLLEVALLALVATGFNRYSYQVYEFILVHQDIVRVFPLTHFLPPNFKLVENKLALVWTALTLMAARYVFVRRGCAMLPQTVLVLGLVAAWMQSYRIVVYVVLASIPVIGEAWNVFWHEHAVRAGSGKAGRAALVLVLAAEVVLSIRSVTHRRTFYPETDIARLSDRLAREPVDGNLFNEFTLGAFLLWHAPGPHRIFIDPRVTPYFRSGVLKDYSDVFDLRDWQEIFSVYHVKYAILDTNRLFTRVLMRQPEWKPLDRVKNLVLLKKGRGRI